MKDGETEDTSGETQASDTEQETGETADTGETGETDADAFPSCNAYFDDSSNEELLAACIAELGCDELTSQETCAGANMVFAPQEYSVSCSWGRVFTGTYDNDMCVGSYSGTCVPAKHYGEGGPQCHGTYDDTGESLTVLNIECSYPLENSKWKQCQGSNYEQDCTCAFE